MTSRDKWNREIRDSVDSLLKSAGYDEDSSARHQLGMMNFDGTDDPTPRKLIRSLLEEYGYTQLVTEIQNIVRENSYHRLNCGPFTTIK